MEQQHEARPETRREEKGGSRIQAKGRPARQIHIPELYRLPAGGREMQGCMKARA
jgi:hypothetical protein